MNSKKAALESADCVGKCSCQILLKLSNDPDENELQLSAKCKKLIQTNCRLTFSHVLLSFDNLQSPNNASCQKVAEPEKLTCSLFERHGEP